MLPTAVTELPEVAWDLEYDPVTDVLWFVAGSGDDASLYYLEREALRRATNLPKDEYSGVHHRVQVLPEGDVMLNGDYGLIRYDAESGNVERLEFELASQDALPGALDPNNPLPGTWISAFTVNDDLTYVARNNVPFVEVVDSADRGYWTAISCVLTPHPSVEPDLD